MNVDAIDLVGENGHHRPRDTFAADLVVEPLALGGGAGFRIGKTVDSPIGMQDHGAGHHRAGKTAATNFVNARHRHETVAVESVLDIAACRDLGHLTHRTHWTGRF